MRHGCWSNALFILAGALWVNSGFLAFRIALEFTEGGVLFQSVVIVGTTVLVLLLTAFVYLRALSFGYFWERRVHERKRRPHA